MKVKEDIANDANIRRGWCTKIVFTQLESDRGNRQVLTRARVIGRLARRYSGEYDDLFQSGAERAIKRLKNRRIPKGEIDIAVKYSAMQGMADEAARSHSVFPIPTQLLYVLTELKRVVDFETQLLGRDPKPRELVKELKARLAKRTGSRIDELTVDDKNVALWLNLMRNSNLGLEDLVIEPSEESFAAITDTALTKDAVLNEFKTLLNDGILTPEQKIMVRMHHFQGMTKKEIGKEFGMHPTTVGYHLTKAHERLVNNAKVQILMLRLKEIEE